MYWMLIDPVTRPREPTYLTNALDIPVIAMSGATCAHRATLNMNNDATCDEFLAQLKHLFRIAYRDLGVCQ
jgi:hypothetical protein